MKKYLSPLFVLLLALSMPLFANEHTAPRMVSTSGMGEAKAKADNAEVIMQTSSTQKTATAAKSEVDRRVNLFLDKLKALGIAKGDIVASGLRLSPEYSYDNRTRTFAGYSASRDVTVTLKDLEKLNNLLESATESDIGTIQQIRLQSSKEDQLRQQAFEAAIADSKAKAEALAKAYGAELGAVYNITYQSATPMLSPKMEAGMVRTMAADMGGGGQYLHDDITVSDQVQVVFELMIPH
jgi:uncharacterized protein YggE